MEMNRIAGANGPDGEPPFEEYYVKLGIGHDHLLRCKDCHRLVTHENVITVGGCRYCGCRRLVQISTLSVWEWLKIRLRVIDFPYRKEFLQEFARVKG